MNAKIGAASQKNVKIYVDGSPMVHRGNFKLQFDSEAMTLEAGESLLQVLAFFVRREVFSNILFFKERIACADGQETTTTRRTTLMQSLVYFSVVDVDSYLEMFFSKTSP